ncbi:MAG: Fis family transcriptional regulator [Deltaproteobacteria bacterium]|nr:MAG: Fis family transcriptional regulator [Pseudomonadota bacterium]PIE65794.1 MAG: Fis family transcriptional regulator [Deltaproteobacteria bacterium]
MLQGAAILVVDDERSMREFLEILLRQKGCTVILAEGGQRARDLLDERDFDVVITDLKMPEVSGLDVLAHARKQRPETEVIMVTAFATAETAIKAMKDGAYDYLTKPFKVDEIIVTVERALEKRTLLRDNAVLRQQLGDRYKLHDLIGRSEPMQALFELIRKVAPARTSVLISGESGTGKELVARAIHAQSERASRPFVAVNCGAIPSALIESELFGHTRGAFTGANQASTGLFKAADGGTLFLDEIAELDPSMQVKLLRALQERRVKPVGGVEELSIDVRVIAATNRDLDEEVEAQRFRSDLFYRLNVLPLTLPPLRSRQQDIPLLTDHFVRRFAAQSGRRITGLTPEAMELLCSYHYPGNVRELENLVERAVILATGPQVDESALPELKRRKTPTSENPAVLPEGGLDLDRHIGEVEKSLLLTALERSHGNRTEAARMLGITLRSIRYRLSKYGVES